MINFIAGSCDKCGRQVLSRDDAVNLEVLSGQAGFDLLMIASPRHLLPIVENGVVVCEGDPSQAQYLEGQPRDERGHPYKPELQTVLRDAYSRMQAPS